MARYIGPKTKIARKDKNVTLEILGLAYRYIYKSGDIESPFDWNQIELYIRDRSEAEFSHSLCPECAKKLYPDLDIHND